MLHFKYKVLRFEPKTEFKNLPGGKALATDHRGNKMGTSKSLDISNHT